MNSAAQLAYAVASGGRAFRDGARAADGLVDLGARERVDEIGFEGEVDLRRGRQLGGTVEEVRGAAEVKPVERPPTGGSQARSRLRCELGVLQAQLAAVPDGLLEVVAEELVQLDDGGPVTLEPVGKARVQVCSRGLRQSVVSGVPDQEMAEAEAVFAGDLCFVRRDQLLAGKRGEARRHRPLAG